MDLVAHDFIRPNGLAFSPDERLFYIADTRRNHIRVFDLTDSGRLHNGRVFATCTSGVFDGIRLGDSARIWAAAGDGVHCFDSDGTLTGKALMREPVSTVVFGGLKRNWLSRQHRQFIRAR